MVKKYARDFLNNYKAMMESLPEKALVYFLPYDNDTKETKYAIPYTSFFLKITAIVESENLVYHVKIFFGKINTLFGDDEKGKEQIEGLRKKVLAKVEEIKQEFRNHKNRYEILHGQIVPLEEVSKLA